MGLQCRCSVTFHAPRQAKRLRERRRQSTNLIHGSVNPFHVFQAQGGLTANDALPPRPAMKRNATIRPALFANPHPMLNARKSKLATCKTGIRPYTSEQGARMRGPMAKARTNTDRIIDCTKGSETCRSRAMTPSAGATIDEVTGEMKAKEETTRVANHFSLFGQF